MTPLRFATMVLCIGLLLPVTGNAASLEDEVKAAYASWDAAFNEADAKGIAAFYTDETLFLPASHDVIKDRSGVESFFAGLFANGVTGHKLELIEALGNDELVVAAARWSAQGKDDAGAPATFGGIATHVFEKQDSGKLRLKLHTFN